MNIYSCIFYMHIIYIHIDIVFVYFLNNDLIIVIHLQNNIVFPYIEFYIESTIDISTKHIPWQLFWLQAHQSTIQVLTVRCISWEIPLWTGTPWHFTRNFLVNSPTSSSMCNPTARFVSLSFQLWPWHRYYGNRIIVLWIYCCCCC